MAPDLKSVGRIQLAKVAHMFKVTGLGLALAENDSPLSLELLSLVVFRCFRAKFGIGAQDLTGFGA